MTNNENNKDSIDNNSQPNNNVIESTEYSTTTTYKSIRDWREDERPRERLIRHGAHTLTDAELIAILLGSGTVGTSAIDVARTLLERFSSLSGIAQRELGDLRKIKGIGTAKAVTLLSAFELSKRIEQAPFESKRVIRSPSDIASYYIPRLRGAVKETFRILLLNTANQIFREVIVSEGSLNATIVHPREVFRSAISDSANSIILMHNHPSGNTEPSREDIAITKQLTEAGKLIDIQVLDHLIIAGEQYTSLKERGVM